MAHLRLRIVAEISQISSPWGMRRTDTTTACQPVTTPYSALKRRQPSDQHALSFARQPADWPTTPAYPTD